MTRFARPYIEGLSPYYDPRPGRALRMDTNTNPLGENPVCQQALRECAGMELGQYPSTYGTKLREALADLYRLRPENFVVGNGSDEILDIICKTYMQVSGRLVMAYPAYSLHGWFATVNGGTSAEVDLDDEFQLRVDAMLEAPGDLVILCTPNNPTSNLFRPDDVRSILEQSRRVVVVDEAYGEFAGESFIPLVNEYENLIVTRTFSKAYALAGMRVGYSVANPELTKDMQKVRVPYTLDKVSEHAASLALGQQDFVRRAVEVVRRERPHLHKGLEDLGLMPYPSDANFILFRCPFDSAEFVRRLATKDVMVRDFGRKRMLKDCARTTIGTREQNDITLEKMAQVVGEWR
jgi:histidinol-phosphate aminotransferase